jgi:hypothetical protein
VPILSLTDDIEFDLEKIICLHTSSTLYSFYRLGDLVMSWESWPSRSGCFWVCPCRADNPRGGGGRSAQAVFVACSSCSCSASLLIRCVFEFWLGEVSDGPRVLGGQSVCSLRTIRFSGFASGGSVGFNGQSAAQAGRSAVPVRTVRGTLANGPLGSCGQCAPPGRTIRQSLVVLLLGSIPSFLLSCFRVCFKESFLRLEVDP